MKATPASDPRCTRPDLAADLPRWDRLGGGRRADLEIHASHCNHCGPRLELLKLAEAWLLECGVNACPPAELLYDYGAGPGHLPLPQAERERVAEHLEHCSTCEGFVESLASAPPPPLELEVPVPSPISAWSGRSAGEPLTLLSGRHVASSTESWSRILPLTAAAALFLFVALWNPTQRSSADLAKAALANLPHATTMRGASDSILVAPRGKLLALADPQRGGVPARPLTFEVDPPPVEEGTQPPTGYRVRVFASVGDPFEEGRLIAEFVSERPLIEAPDLVLTPGDYTWEAWVQRGSVESRIDGREFNLVVDNAFLDRIRAFEGLAEPMRTVARVNALHEAGYESDARALVRSLEPGPERDAYLAAFPAR